jgi:glycosyltransferase involved in cell wall biosynthesis
MFENPEQGISTAKSKLEEFCATVDISNIPSGSSELSKITLALKSLLSKDPYNINWLKSNEYAEKIKHALNEKNYDLVHFDTICLYPFLPLIPENIATSLDHHNIESEMLHRRSSNERNPLKKLYFWQEAKRLESYEKEFCTIAGINITCSELDSQRLLTLVPEACAESIPNGVDISYFTPIKPETTTEKRIIFIGRLNWYPNTKAVLYIANQLWPLLKKEIPNIKCDIIGANPPAEIVELSKLDSSFKVHGFVDDILPFMKPETIYICPITDGGGTKLKILDALAMGMPIIADPIACEGINVTDQSNVLFSNTLEQYIENIKNVFEDSGLSSRLSINARELAEQQYSYNSIGVKLSDSYINTIQQHRNKPI